jgi:hypothetical protein
LAFGVDALKDHPEGPPFWIFCGSAFALGLSIVSGLWYLLRSYAYAGLREGNPRTDARVVAAKKLCDKWFNFLIYSFGAGIFSFAIFGGAFLFSLHLETEPTLQLGSVGSPTAPTLVVERDGHLWLLKPGVKGYGWQPLPRPQ